MPPAPHEQPDISDANGPAPAGSPGPLVSVRWPVPPGAPALLIGGSFDPPHEGHTGLAQAARAAVDPALWLVFVPAARSPHKARGPRASDADRTEMLRLALAGVERCAVWTEEIHRAHRTGDDASYWIDTLRAARAAVGERSLRFLIGSDQTLAFHRWREPRGILRLADPVVVLREPVGSVAALAAGLRGTGFWSETELARWTHAAVLLPLIEVSSTAIRRALACGAEPAGLSRPVWAFARERAIYHGT